MTVIYNLQMDKNPKLFIRKQFLLIKIKVKINLKISMPNAIFIFISTTIRLIYQIPFHVAGDAFQDFKVFNISLEI